MPADLAIILPVFNEQASVRKVVHEWFQEVENWTENFSFLCLNDGSTDDTLKILNRLRDQLGPRLEVFTHTNRGHGQTCRIAPRSIAFHYTLKSKRGAQGAIRWEPALVLSIFAYTTQ